MNAELDALLRQLGLDPAKACNLTPAAEQALMVGLRSAVGAGEPGDMQAPVVAGPAATWGTGDLLTINEAATELRVTPRWLYRHAKTLPFTRKLSRKVLRFSRSGIARWVASRRT